jgi:zinc/manganese transport system substrate-binding protein/manganese/iron transport system substrate-binding protein
VVAGSRLDDGTVQLTQLIRPNVDAHDFEPSAADTLAVARADVLLANGVGFEAFLHKLVRSAEPDVPVTDTSRGVRLRHEDGHDDPHIWHDPRNAIVMVGHVADALEAADPDGAATYRGNAARYVDQLKDLDRQIESRISALDDRVIVTNHDALGYYADRYGLDVVGTVIPSFDSSAETSAADVDRLVAAIRSSGARAVFSEASLPEGQADAIAREAGVEVVSGPDALYTDGLGARGSDGATYLQMMRHNTTAIVDALR